MEDNMVTLYPYWGIQYKGKTTTFDTHWRQIERSFGLPDSRFLEINPHESEIDNTTPRIIGEKADFKEIRGPFQLVYESGTLQMIEIIGDISLQMGDHTFSHNANEDYIYCTEQCAAEFFPRTKTFAVDKAGLLVKSLNKNGYAVCSRATYNGYVSFMRFYEAYQSKVERDEISQ